MRIGELAAIAGVSTRTVRHYHRVGLLPEPARQANGYREYGLRDAVELARVRRLTELGLSLEEVRDALADDAGKDLHEILAELDADLGRQQEAMGGAGRGWPGCWNAPSPAAGCRRRGQSRRSWRRSSTIWRAPLLVVTARNRRWPVESASCSRSLRRPRAADTASGCSR